jgi:uncharacterized protein (DUF2147 family)
MMSFRRFLLFAAALSLTATSGLADSNNDPTGIWLTGAGDAKIRISQCGTGICGTLVWLKVPIDPATGRPQEDDKNKNPALAHRPIIGINIFNGMKLVSDRKWTGHIYNADNGKTYSSDVTLAGPTKLAVRGCVLAVLCGGETWTKLVGVAEVR